MCRGVAQSGSALVSGSRGRRFESYRPDHCSGLFQRTYQSAFRALGRVFPEFPSVARAEHLLDADEFLARGAFAGAGGFGGFDMLPVAEGDHVDAAAFEQRVETGAAGFAGCSTR